MVIVASRDSPFVSRSSASMAIPGRRSATARPGTSVVTTSPTRLVCRGRDVYAGTSRSTAATRRSSSVAPTGCPQPCRSRVPRSRERAPTPSAGTAAHRSRRRRLLATGDPGRAAGCAAGRRPRRSSDSPSLRRSLTSRRPTSAIAMNPPSIAADRLASVTGRVRGHAASRDRLVDDRPSKSVGGFLAVLAAEVTEVPPLLDRIREREPVDRRGPGRAGGEERRSLVQRSRMLASARPSAGTKPAASSRRSASA